MFGQYPWGGCPWGGFLGFQGEPSGGHGGFRGAGRMVRMLLAQEAERSVSDFMVRRAISRMFQETASQARMRMVQEMEAKIATADADDLFLALAV